jgi:hypothetical protein
MMAKAGKILRAHEALRIELEARPGATLVIGASDARKLVTTGATVPIYQIVRGDDVDIVQEVGTAYGTKTGKGLALNITTGMPVLPALYASKAQVRDVYRGLRAAAPVSALTDLSPQDRHHRPRGEVGAAVVSAPADLAPQPEARKATDRPTLKRGFGDAANFPRRPSPAPVIVV